VKIGILGTHGVGKTTLASKFFTYCISKGKNTRFIHEVVRDCPFGIHDEQSIDTVSWIVTRQIQQELNAKSKNPDIIICDRTSVDPVMYLYAKLGVKLDEYGQYLSDLAHTWLQTYDCLIFIQPSNTPITPDGFRDTDVTFQKSVDAEFCITMTDFIETNRDKQIYYLKSDAVFACDFPHLFENIIGENK